MPLYKNYLNEILENIKYNDQAEKECYENKLKGITKLQLVLLLHLQCTPAKNPPAPGDLPAGPVLPLSPTYTRENRCTSACMAHGKTRPHKENRTNGNPTKSTYKFTTKTR